MKKPKVPIRPCGCYSLGDEPYEDVESLPIISDGKSLEEMAQIMISSQAKDEMDVCLKEAIDKLEHIRRVLRQEK